MCHHPLKAYLIMLIIDILFFKGGSGASQTTFLDHKFWATGKNLFKDVNMTLVGFGS